MSTKADDVLSRDVSWDTTYAKARMDEFVDKAADISRENTNRSLSAFLPLLFSSIFSALKFPLTVAATAGGYLADKVMPAANQSVDSSTRCSSDVAKRSIHATIDTAADSSRWTWGLFN